MGGQNRGLAIAARVLLGLIFFVFGLNGFLNFIPAPPAPRAAEAFAGALFQTGYFFPLLKSTEIVAAVLLLSGRFVPLALVVLAPIIMNIVAFHTFLAPDPVMPTLVLVPEIYLAWTWRGAFKPLFTTPTAVRPLAHETAEGSLAYGVANGPAFGGRDRG